MHPVSRCLRYVLNSIHTHYFLNLTCFILIFSANGDIELDLCKVHRNPGTQDLCELISELRSILSHFTNHQPTYHLASFVGTMSPNSESKMMSATCLNSGSRWTKRMMADVFINKIGRVFLTFSVLSIPSCPSR